jgi:hypothetical protein
MPRNLTDLMETAVATAPPEPHHAADITRLAQRHQRRRTTLTAGAAALMVFAAGVAGYGVTRDQQSTLEPANRYQRDQTVDLSQAVPASSLPGYTLEPWTIPSVQHLGAGDDLPTYQAVDATGRLLVVDAPGGNRLQGPFRTRLYDSPGGPAQPLQPPASPGTVGSVPITWLPQFYGADQLLWHPSAGRPGSQNGFHITDLQGGHDEFVPATFRVGNAKLVANADDVTGRSLWMTLPVGPMSKSGQTVSDVYRATFSGHATKVGTSVSAFDVGPGMAGWVTTHGRVFVQSATGAPPRRVRVPLDSGCRVLPAKVLQGTFAVTSSAVALTEFCGSGDKATEQLVAFDLSGRPLVRVTGVLAFNLSFAGDTLVFQANGVLLRYDLVTGTLSQLSAPKTSRILQAPRGAGRYVLWYDKDGGNVARIPG